MDISVRCGACSEGVPCKQSKERKSTAVDNTASVLRSLQFKSQVVNDLNEGIRDYESTADTEWVE
jgi:hypothetical protein